MLRTVSNLLFYPIYRMRLQEEIKLIKKHKQIERVTLSFPGIITVHTAPLTYLVDDSCYGKVLGRYQIELSLLNPLYRSAIFIHNKDYYGFSSSGRSYDHPFIARGEPCFGGETLPYRLLKNHNIYHLVNFLIAYLEEADGLSPIGVERFFNHY